LEGNIKNLDCFYNLGVRSICLTWNHKNEIASGNGAEVDTGLTPFGVEVVSKMDEMGMIIDLSHISEKSYYDVLAISKKPVICSHSNAKKICNHKRNLTDDQLVSLKRIEGVTGINFYPTFLNNDETASVKDIINHIEYISGLIGIDYIGIGADFDGVDSLPEGISGVQDLEKVFNELLKLNYSEENVKKIAGKNFLRVIKTCLN
jgi:membrane dipeptidase